VIFITFVITLEYDGLNNIVAIRILLQLSISSTRYIYSTPRTYLSRLTRNVLIVQIQADAVCNMRSLAFLLLLGTSFGEFSFENITNNIVSEGCVKVSTSVALLPFPKVASSTGKFTVYPTSLPLRLPLPIWENKTRTSCNSSNILATTATSPNSESRASATWNVSSPTAPPEFYSAGWGVRHSNSALLIQQALGLLLILLPVASWIDYLG
jgi:hypothetical protein